MIGYDNLIPVVGHHRGVGLHDQQSPARLEQVKREIDHVLDHLHDLERLYVFARLVSNSPEARMLAAAKIQAALALRAEDKRSLPQTSFDKEDLAAAAGPWLNSQDYRSATHYGSHWDVLLAHPGEPQPVPREVPLPRSEGI